MLETREIQLTVERKYDKNASIRPTIIPWKDTKMIRNHSVGATIQEILQAVSVEGSQDVVNINIIGDPSSGKTTQAKTIGHLIHKRSTIPFAVRIFRREDLLKFEETLKALSPANYVLIFDDLSFLGADATSRQIELAKKAASEIRHLPGGQDVKIVVIKNFHYTLGLPKYLRSNDFTYFTTVGSEEKQNMQGIVGEKYMNEVYSFKKLKNKLKIAPEGHKTFTYQLLKNKPRFVYTYKKPFIPLLYWNGLSLRQVVSPTREWIDPVCSTCEQLISEEKFHNEIDISKFVDESGKKFGETIFKRAVILKLKEQGIINALPPAVVRTGRYLDKVLGTGRITLQHLAVHYKLEPTIVRLREKIPDFIKNPSLTETPALPNLTEPVQESANKTDLSTTDIKKPDETATSS